MGERRDCEARVTEQAETEESAPTTAELDAKVNALDSKLDRIIDMFGGAEGKAHDAAQQHTEERLDRPSTVAEEIRAQLAEQRAREQADAKGREDADWRRSVDERISGMAENVPETPVRWIENKMGWR